MKYPVIYEFRLDVDKSERIDKLLSNYFPEYSRSTIQRWISNLDVLIDGNTCSQKDKISSSCNISIKITSQPSVELIPEDIDLEIIDETDDYIVINKNLDVCFRQIENIILGKKKQLSNSSQIVQ